MPRIRFVSAAMTLAGVAAAQHNEPLGPLWFDALGRSADEAAELMDQVNRERGLRKVMANVARGGPFA